MKKNGTTFSRTADGTDLCDTKGSVEVFQLLMETHVGRS